MNSFKKNILLVEDDDDYRSMLVSLLVKKGYQVKEAANGKLALHELSFSPFDLIISDIKMPVMHGLDLLTHAKKKYPNTPFLLMTGFSYILETQEAYSLGANDFILKPFQVAEFLRLVYKYCEPRVEETKERADQTMEYFAIPIDEFVSGTNLLYDLYIKLTKYKFLKIASVDDVIDSEIIGNYKKKGIEFLYINKEDYRLYLGFNIQVYRAVEGARKFSKETHAHLITNITGMFNSLVYEGQIDETLVDEMKEFCHKGFSLISDNDDLMKIIASINDASAEETVHCSSVAFIASTIAKKLCWYSKGTAHKLFLAAFLHDIGKKNFSSDLLTKSPSLMTKDEFDQYKEHATHGKDILIDQRSIPSDVVKAVYDHHENYNGSGFPNGIKRDFIHPFARVIRIADDFSRYNYPLTGEPRSIKESLKLMLEHKQTEYDPDILNAFLKIFNTNN